MSSHNSPEAIMSKGSKSFSFASLFFSKEEHIAAAKIYSWCRHCDDLADEGDLTKNGCDILRVKTLEAWTQDKLDPPFSYLQEVVSEYKIPSDYALDLIQGMENDVEGKRYETLNALREYCYFVAGTVGLIMSHVMGVFRASALDKAVELGIAMQLTNICRDVKEDFSIGRIYLPLEYLKEENIDPANLMNLEYRENLFRVVKRVIKHSEESYKKGQKGIIDLPLRAAFVITLAYRVYREINHEILRKGVVSLDSRTVVPTYIKVIHVFSSLAEVMLSIPKRVFRNQEVVRALPVWRGV